MSYPDDFPIPHVRNPIKVVRLVPIETPVKTPFMDFCPCCRQTIITRVNTHIGMCWWLLCCTGFFFFPPFLCLLCCNVSKDIDHTCPNCGHLIAISHRTGF